MTKILLVEDDKSLREIYGTRLLAEGYDITSAGDGEEALALAIKERPALIVSDVMMPKISGFDMLDILRSTTETKDIKVIMMTALSSEDQRQRGVQLGADRYLVKSQVGIEDVVRTVHEVLGDMPGGAMPAAPATLRPAVAPTPPPAQAAPSAPAVAPAPQPSIATTPPIPAPTPVIVPPQPAPMATPQAPTPAPVAPAPPQPAPTSSGPAPAPLPQPGAIPTPASQTPPPAEPVLPQPTAPFSTPRPGASNRVIEPLPAPDASSSPDINSLISQELAADSTPPAPGPIAPAPQQPATATPAPTPPPRPQAPTPEPSGLNFEETPRL